MASPRSKKRASTVANAPTDAIHHLRQALADEVEVTPPTAGTILSLEPHDLVMTAIDAHTQNVRRSMDPVELAQLQQSLTRYGLLEPIVVEPIPGKRAGHRYRLIAGFRRYTAAKALGWDTIPARVLDRTLSPQERVAVQLTENLQRESMRMRDVVQSIQALREEQMTLPAIAEVLGLGVSTVRLYAQLAELLTRNPKLWPYFDRSLISIEQFRVASRLLTRIKERAGERIVDPGQLELIRVEAETLFVQFLERLAQIQPLTVKRVNAEVGQWLAKVGVEPTPASAKPGSPAHLFNPVMASYDRLDIQDLDGTALETLITLSEAKIDAAKSRLEELARR